MLNPQDRREPDFRNREGVETQPDPPAGYACITLVGALL